MKSSRIIARFVIVWCSMTASLPSGLWAQDQNDGVLAGPKVEEDASKGRAMMGPQAQARRGASELPFDQWMAALRELDLSQQQQDAVRAISQEFQEAQRAYRQSLSEEDQNAVRQGRQAREAGQQPAAEIRERLRKIEENRPKALEYQERLWDQLTAEQQEQMKARLAELREQADERRQRRQERTSTESRTQADRPNRAAGASEPATESNGEMSMEGSQMDELPPRGGRANRGAAHLDEMGQRRLEFLLAHQSKSAKRPGRAATDEDRTFDFHEQ